MALRQHWIESDRRNYRVKKARIQDALRGSTGILDGVTKKNEEDIFYMLLFCLCVPQSKAIKAEEAIDILRSKDFFRNNLTRAELLQVLTGRVRFQSTKADRLIRARESFFTSDLWDDLTEFYISYRAADGPPRQKVLFSARSYLMKHINGMGMKLSGHFLRNIGMPGLAILDVHILAGLEKRGLITEKDIKPLTKAKYEKVSSIMNCYADQVGISIDELDMLFWSQRTGFVFK